MDLMQKKQIRRILEEKKKIALQNSKRGMIQLISSENKPDQEDPYEESAISVAFHNEVMQNVKFESQRDLIRQVDSALERIEEGTYGLCEECNEQISEKRLKIIPFARYCWECQGMMENRNNRWQ